MPRLRDLVDCRALGLRVLSGEEQLERKVRWVHVTELADPSAYLREDELVLTNGLTRTGVLTRRSPPQRPASRTRAVSYRDSAILRCVLWQPTR